MKKRMTFMIIISISSIVIAFYNIFMILIRDFKNEVNTIEIQVERYVEISDSLSKMMTLYGNDFFLQDTSEESKFYPYIQYDARTNSYHLDNINEIEDDSQIGNITGHGKIPTKGKAKDEINLTFQFFQLFQSIHDTLPDTAWIYYVSDSEFIGLYPWIPSTDFSYSDKIKHNAYYSRMLPANNPKRESAWVPLYRDNAGKGLIVTLTSPIYDGQAFKGVVCIDLTSKSIGNLLESSYKGYLIDEVGNVIASSRYEQGEDIIGIGSILPYSREEWELLDSYKDDKLSFIDGNLVYYMSVTNAPWKLIYNIPLYIIILKSVLYASPVIFICLLLIFATVQVKKQKNAEALLTTSLEELTSYQTILENAAHYDFLTKAYNRRGLLLKLEDRIKDNQNLSVPMSFIICDIDRFKKINDTYGHSAGDKILIELTKYLKDYVKGLDVVCRWGGEEFVILLCRCTYQNAIWNAKELRKGVEKLEVMWEGVYIPITMTFGVVEYNYIDSLEECIEKADQALYKGKESGRNRVVGYMDGNTSIYE